MAKFCIRRLNVEFRKISEDLYSVIDLSEYDYSNFEDVLTGTVMIEIETPSNEGFSVLIPAGRSQIFSCKNSKILPLHDGQYCVSTKSCGAPIKKMVGYYPNLKEKLDGLVMTTKDKKYIHYLFVEYNLMKILDEHDNKKDAARIYQDISDMLEACSSGGGRMAPVRM